MHDMFTCPQHPDGPDGRVTHKKCCGPPGCTAPQKRRGRKRSNSQPPPGRRDSLGSVASTISITIESDEEEPAAVGLGLGHGATAPESILLSDGDGPDSGCEFKPFPPPPVWAATGGILLYKVLSVSCDDDGLGYDVRFVETRSGCHHDMDFVIERFDFLLTN